MRVGGVFYQVCLFICCTENHTCTVVNNGTCVLSAHTVLEGVALRRSGPSYP